VSAIPDSSPQDDPALREALKRCSPATYYAACKFKSHGRSEDLRAVIFGIVERFVERELRPKLLEANEGLRLSEDLGIDSLTMMEIVMIAEDVLPISVSNEELTKLRTLGEVHAFVVSKLAHPSRTPPPRKVSGNDDAWDIAASTEEMRHLDAKAPNSIGERAT
jgi:acyl carrier protein